MVHCVGRGQRYQELWLQAGARRGTRAIASAQLRARVVPKAMITSAETYGKPKIFELDCGIGAIASVLLNCLGLPRCEVAPTFLTAVSNRASWSFGGAQLAPFAETIGVRSTDYTMACRFSCT